MKVSYAINYKILLNTANYILMISMLLYTIKDDESWKD